MHEVFRTMNTLGKEGTPFLFVLDFELKRPRVLPLADIRPEHIQYDIGPWSNATAPSPAVAPLQFSFTPPAFDHFRKAYQQVQKELQFGNTYLLNLTFRVPIRMNWDLNTVFAQAKAKYKLRYKNQFVVFSPEPFIKIDRGIISTFPMKGTIDADISNAKVVLLNDPKEDAEHATIVDLMRNDLSMHAKKVEVVHYKYLELLHTNRGNLWQMSSRIDGQLPDDYAHRIGDILHDMLPAGSISGAPKPKTIDIIRRVERHKRRYYTGVMGIFDGRRLESSVMIRYIENYRNAYYYRTGGGITFQSELKKEYEELIKKIYVPITPTNL